MSKVSSFLLVFLLTKLTALTINGKSDVIIKNVKSGLVLDASESIVKLQPHEIQNKYQLWDLETTKGVNLHIIRNKKSGQVLDIDGDGSGAYVITTSLQKEKLGSTSSQLWELNSDGRIINSYNNLAIDVEVLLWQTYEGTNLMLYPKTKEADNQIFDIS